MKHNYESNELIHEMNLLKNTFDVVRLIDVKRHKQCTFLLKQTDIQYGNYECYSMCKENHYISNCILIKAFQNKTIYTKFEFFHNDIYYFVAKYVQVNGLDYVLELISKMNKNKMFDYRQYNSLDIPKEYPSSKKVKIGRKLPRMKNSMISFDQLLESINNNEFYLLYQPKIENLTGRVIGLEALIRWTKMDSLLNSSESFIIDFEKNKLIHLIDYYVLRKIIELMRNWKEHRKKIIPISINMCCSTLLRDDFFLTIEVMMGNDTFASEIEIEITERNIPLNKIKELTDVVERLKKIGFHIALDDFGAYSANYPLVLELNIDTLKIDKSMIANIKHNMKIQKILENTFSICKAFDIRVIVEGVEEKEQLQILTSIGSEFSQGYYFSEPVPLSSIKQIY
ncbi:EAL domain-containing protein [Anaerovorax sp. IOR16]|uniref:EAL domain-containing protein n=1 Tax=Anaerovorax sp. IOR16 TaxID=2773458 RepID=UPI0019D06F8C|nr:EAL domain-containing protein [Anaerovorax sp. IOR16]